METAETDQNGGVVARSMCVKQSETPTSATEPSDCLVNFFLQSVGLAGHAPGADLKTAEARACLPPSLGPSMAALGMDRLFAKCGPRFLDEKVSRSARIAILKVFIRHAHCF